MRRKGKRVTMTKHPLTVVLVTYNSAHQIADCVNMLADRGPEIRVRIRDNGSTDSTPQLLKELAAEGYIDDLILASEDAGYSIAANDVIRRSGNDNILIMNPDARVSLETIQLLRDAIYQDPTLGLVTPVVSSGDEISVMSAGRQPRLWPMFTHYSGLSRAFPKSKALRGRHLFLSQHSHEDQFVEWTSGCCLLIPGQRSIAWDTERALVPVPGGHRVLQARSRRGPENQGPLECPRVP